MFVVMGKVVRFQKQGPEKFGYRPIHKRKKDHNGQLDLFSECKVLSLSKSTPFEEAVLLDEQKDYARAVIMYKKAIEVGDSVADAYCNLGILESEKQHYSKAIDYFTNCLLKIPRHFEGHYNLANLYAEMGNFPLAKLHYQIAIELEPQFSNSYFNIALTLVMLRDIKEALIALQMYCSIVSEDEQKPAEELIEKLTRTLLS